MPLIQTTEKLRMAEVIHQFHQLSEGNAIVVTDVGQHQMITSRYYKFNQPNHNVTSGGLAPWALDYLQQLALK
jgi:acetolactate synthase-1/2/3 large subunit